MRSFTARIGGTVIVLSGILAQARPAAPFTVEPARSFDKNSGVLVDVPEEKGKLVVKNVEFGGTKVVGAAGAKHRQAVGLGAAMGQFGWCSMDLGRKFEKGRYRVEYTLYAAKDKAAAIALYAASEKNQMQITDILGCPAGGTQTGEKFFFATEPFTSLVIKKMDAAKTPSVALVKAVITDLHEREYPRLAGYRTLFQYPAPWGLRDKAIEAKTSRMECIGEIEAWLDRRSQASELLGRADNLLLAHRLLSLPVSKAKVEQAYTQVRNLRFDSLTDFEKTLNAFQAELEKSAGGTLDPANGTDIFTWVKSWTLTGVDTLHESGEATPFLAAYSDNVSIRFMKRGDVVDMESSWTTNIYTSPTMTVTYSILTPLAVTDLKTNVLSAEISGLKKLRDDLPQGWFALDSPGHLYLFVSNRKIEKLDCTDKDLRVSFGRPAAIGYMKLPIGEQQKLPALARFYRAMLLHQPVQCVQVQKGDRIEQAFAYVDRPCDGAVKPLAAAPLPHMMCLGLAPASRLKVKFAQPVRHGPDGWAYTPNTNRIAYDLPKLPRAHTAGTNIWADLATKQDYVDLRKHGCRTIRLVLCGISLWEDLSMDARKDIVVRNLRWIREVGGLTVGIDLHNQWHGGLNSPEGFSDPAVLTKFIDRWKTIMAWCESYQDVIGWYDLLNEPQIFYERMDVKPYAVFMRKAIQALRPCAGKTPLLVECVNMANPVGLQFWEDLGDNNIIVGYHDYYPHIVTHQRCVDGGDSAMPAVFYPSFMPMIEWSSPSWRNNCPEWYYWDRWKCNSISLPVYRLLIEHGYRFDCGEYGVVGYAGQTSPLSGVTWLRHTLERFRHIGINHDVWGVHGGFTWYSDQIREVLFKFWTENN